MHTTWNWLYKLDFKYKNVNKNVFIDGNKQPDIIPDHQNFLKIIKKLKSYFNKFNKNKTIKAKRYPSNYAIKSANC